MSRFFVLAGLFIAAIAPVAAQTTPFTKIADSATPIPGGTGNFVTFSNMVSIDADGNVGLSESNYNDPSNDGIHLSVDGILSRVAGRSTSIPSGTGTFTSFSFFGNGIDDGIVAFRGLGSSEQKGVYAYDSDGEALSLIADTSTAIPNGTGTFTAFTTAYADGGSYAFIAGGDSSQQGIYLSTGMSLTRIADKTTTVPDIGGTYGWSSQLGFDGGNLSFWSNVAGGSTPGEIIGGYTPGGGLVTLVTTATMVPIVNTPFTQLSSPADLSGTTVAFRGAYAGGDGIFTIDLAGGAITTIARKNTAPPGDGGNFVSFTPPCIDGDVIAFQGYSTTGAIGLYLFHEGRLRKVISTADQLDGKSLASVTISENSLAGGYLAFRADFTDTTTGIYRLTISELVDATEATAPAEKAALTKKIKRLKKKLKKIRKSGKIAKAKRLTSKLKKLQKKLRRL